MIVADITIRITVKVLAPNVTALDCYRDRVEARVVKALPKPSRTRIDKDTGVRCVNVTFDGRVPATFELAREGGEA